MKNLKKYDIFISYRRSSYEVATLIAKHLESEGYSVFIDMKLRPGRFKEQIYNIIDSCKDFLVILTPNALDRCNNDKDWIQLEICRAIKANKNIIPIMLNGFSWPSPMPTKLEELSNYHALTANTTDFFEFSMHKLKTFLKSKKKNKFYRYLLITAITLCLIYMFVLNIIPANLSNPEYPECDGSYTDYLDSLTLYSLDSCLLKKYGVENIMTMFNEAKAGIADAQCDFANICYDSGKYKDALYWFSLSAKQENGLAANGIGRCYYHAKGVSRSPRNALAWFIKSAKMHCPEGMNNAGKCYFEGFGINFSNKKEAIKYYTDAANAKYAPAQFNLGIMYMYVLGGDENFKEGLKWLKRAAYNGSPEAKLTLGDIYSEGYMDIKKNLEMALKLYNEATQSDSPEVSEQANIRLKKIKQELLY